MRKKIRLSYITVSLSDDGYLRHDINGERETQILVWIDPFLLLTYCVLLLGKVLPQNPPLLPVFDNLSPLDVPPRSCRPVPSSPSLPEWIDTNEWIEC